jgi:acetylornithine aminotransferase
MKELRSLASIKEIRGMGLMIGIEMYEPCASTRNNLLKTYGIMTGASSDPNTLRILPALNLSITDATYFIESFKQLVQS